MKKTKKKTKQNGTKQYNVSLSLHRAFCSLFN